MRGRSRLLWGLSVLLLAWIMLMTAYSYVSEGCRASGGVWDWRRLHCRPAPAIELRRAIERG